MAAPVSRTGLHYLLWMDSGGSGTLRVRQTVLAEELGVTAYTVNRLLKELELQRRIIAISSPRGSKVRTYEITDPREWE